jgi:hypothetical protein
LERRLYLDSKAVTMTQDSSVVDPDNFGPDPDLAYGTKPNPHPTPEKRNPDPAPWKIFVPTFCIKKRLLKIGL